MLGDILTIGLVLLALWTFVPRRLRVAARVGIEPTVIVLADYVRSGARMAGRVAADLLYRVLIGRPRVMSEPPAEPAEIPVAGPVAAIAEKPAQLIVMPGNDGNEALPGNAAIPPAARDIIRMQAKAEAVALLLKSAKLTNKAEAIETAFECKRSGRKESTYARALELVNPILEANKYPQRTPEQEAARQELGLPMA